MTTREACPGPCPAPPSGHTHGTHPLDASDACPVACPHGTHPSVSACTGLFRAGHGHGDSIEQGENKRNLEHPVGGRSHRHASARKTDPPPEDRTATGTDVPGTAHESAREEKNTRSSGWHDRLLGEVLREFALANRRRR